MGIIHFILGHYEDALPYLRTALDMQPDASIFQTALRECQEAIALQDALRRAEVRGEQISRPVEPRPEPRPEPTTTPAKASPEERLKKLQELHRKGLLDKKEFEAKKAEILKEL